jgi:hypothetical protein
VLELEEPICLEVNLHDLVLIDFIYSDTPSLGKAQVACEKLLDAIGYMGHVLAAMKIWSESSRQWSSAIIQLGSY